MNILQNTALRKFFDAVIYQCEKQSNVVIFYDWTKIPLNRH